MVFLFIDEVRQSRALTTPRIKRWIMNFFFCSRIAMRIYHPHEDVIVIRIYYSLCVVCMFCTVVAR